MDQVRSTNTTHIRTVNAANAIYKDILDRRGLRQALEGIDQETRVEMIDKWRELIQVHIYGDVG